MNSAEIILRWLSVRGGRGIINTKSGNWLARDERLGDVAAAMSADRLADVLSRDPEMKGWTKLRAEAAETEVIQIPS